jgi:hypothetical protein
MSLDELVVRGIIYSTIGVPLYLGWRFVRALEGRKAAALSVEALSSRLRDLERERAGLLRAVAELGDRQAAIDRRLQRPRE